MTVTYDLSYCGMELMTDVKSLIVQVHGVFSDKSLINIRGKTLPGAQCYKTFYDCNLPMFAVS
jgi:hypothetical protein